MFYLLAGARGSDAGLGNTHTHTHFPVEYDITAFLDV